MFSFKFISHNCNNAIVKFQSSWLNFVGNGVIVIFRSRFVTFLNCDAAWLSWMLQSGLTFNGNVRISCSNNVAITSSNSMNPNESAARRMRFSSCEDNFNIWHQMKTVLNWKYPNWLGIPCRIVGFFLAIFSRVSILSGCPIVVRLVWSRPHNSVSSFAFQASPGIGDFRRAVNLQRFQNIGNRLATGPHHTLRMDNQCYFQFSKWAKPWISPGGRIVIIKFDFLLLSAYE